ncbi:MAG: DEAD/DEAH box helicase [Oscillospiraceae bacterium]|nr:DEAD/DEAH box helicase [Oscillospiraceae bacterium]
MIKLTMDQVRNMFSRTDFEHGLKYFKEDRVLQVLRGPKKEFPEMKFQVKGDGTTYQVSILEKEKGNLLCHCNCYQFYFHNTCKHLSAAMIYCAQHSNGGTDTDWLAKNLLNSYMERGSRMISDPSDAQLLPRLCRIDPQDHEYPTLSFRVGREKLYVVRHLANFLMDVHQKNTVALGKNVTLDHSIECFDDRSRKLIRILMNEHAEFRAIGSLQRAGYSYAGYGNNKNEIILNGNAFDSFFDLFFDENVESCNGPLRFCADDPPVTLRMRKEKHTVTLTVEVPEYTHFFGHVGALYACDGKRLLRCSEDFRERVYPLLKLRHREMTLSYEDLPDFCGCVLPEIEGLVTVEAPEGLLEDYLPEDCTPCFYFDMEDEALVLKLKFRYADREYPEKRQQEEHIRRDSRTERQVSAFALRYFHPEEEGYSLTGEDAVYDFLTEDLARFRELGEVYVTDRLRRKQLPPARASVGVSVSDGMLTLELDTGEFPAGELEGLYQSLLKKKKYHRLQDGRFLTLDGSSYEKLAEIAHMLQLSPTELSKGELKVPAFRALYLDSILSGSDALDITRDRQFRSMIRSFKSIEESDYAVPVHLEKVLRPYQQTGFRWLKTLESCGFGGILADEMGLGKTAQIIAFLASQAQRKHPNLVVCPASLILNWGEEFAKFAPALKISLIYGSAAERKRLISENGGMDVWVTSYELLRQDIRQYQELEFDTCILDEGQHIKNQSTLVSKAVKAISCRQRFVLTGTPIENRLSELWNLFDFLMPGYLFSHRAFVEKLEKPIIKSKNPDAMAQLRKLVQPFLLRREKKDVLKELPPKMEHIRRIALGEAERKVYLSTVHAAKNALADPGKLKILAALTQLRQVCCDPSLCFEHYEGETSKLDACLELCSGMAANGHQILLFSQFTSMLDILRTRLEALGLSTFTLQGSTPKEQRSKLVKEFNAGGAQVFLISLKAGGTGLNLTAADVVIHYDPWWNLAAQNQATDRAHRMGQRQSVHVYKLIAKDTIEERILDLQERKAELLDVISGEGGSILEMSKEELLALLD